MRLEEVQHVLEASDELITPVIVVVDLGAKGMRFYLVDEHNWSRGPEIPPEIFLALRAQGLISERPDQDLSVDGRPTFPVMLR